MAEAVFRNFTRNFTPFYLLFLTFLTISLTSNVPRRTIKMKLHCPSGSSCPSTGVVEVIAAGKTDEVRYLWSIAGAPSITVAHFSPKRDKNELNIAWKGTDVSSIKYKFAPNDTLAMILSAIYEYEDTGDTVNISKSDYVIKYNMLGDINWNCKMTESKNKTECLGRIDGGMGHINMTFIAAYAEGRDTEFPKQRYNSNSTRFRISLDQFQLNDTVTKRRFAFECSFLQSLPATGDNVLNVYRSLDDEYTPSIFKLFQAVLPLNTGFGQWKPIAYKADDLAFHTKVYHSLNADIDDNKTMTEINATKSVATTFIGKDKFHAVNVTFGESKDGFYIQGGKPKEDGKGYEFLSWSGTVGLGVPPQDEISDTVLIIIIAGLGTPTLVLMAGGIYLCVKKYKTSGSYGTIN